MRPSVAAVAGLSRKRGGGSVGSVELPLDTVDYHGVFYYAGTNGETETWTNPETAGRVDGTHSGTMSGAPSHLVNRAENNTYLEVQSYPWYKWDLMDVGTLLPTYLRFRQRSASGNACTKVTVQGSNNDSTWDTLVTDYALNTAVNGWTSVPLTATISYRYLKVIYPRNPVYYCCGEQEFFGTLTL